LGPGNVPIPANLISQTTNRVDTVFGELETAGLQSYRAAGFPNVCEFDTDVVTSFYDYSQTINLTNPVFSGSPLGTTNFGRVLSIIEEQFNLDGQSRVRRALKGSQRAPLHRGMQQHVQGGPMVLNALGFHGTTFARIERLRLQRHAQIWRRLHQAALRHRR
jgi:hypothetical protein